MAELRKAFIERRKGPDIVVKAVWWMVGTGWVLIFIAFMFYIEARPKFETFIDRMVKAHIRNTWDFNVLQYAFFVMLINIAICIIGFIMNMLRQKRKTDKISKSIVVLGIINLSGIIWYLLR